LENRIGSFDHFNVIFLDFNKSKKDVKNSQDKCKMLIRIWNEYRTCWNIYQVDVPGRPHQGPQDKYLKVCQNRVDPDIDGNFLHHNEPKLDSIHAFATARLTIAFWERISNKRVLWPWSLPLFRPRLLIDIDDCLNTCEFSRNERAIVFNSKSLKSFYLVSHETTHAIIQGLRNGIRRNRSQDQIAIEEALCDLSPIFLLFSMSELLKKPVDYIEGKLEEQDLTTELSAHLIENKRASHCIKDMKLVRDNIYVEGDEIVHKIFNKIIEIWDKSPNQKRFQYSLNRIGTLFCAPILRNINLSVDEYLNDLQAL